MTKAIICDIQGVLIDGEVVNENLINFLIESRGEYKELIIYTNLSESSYENIKKLIPEFFKMVNKGYFYGILPFGKTDYRSFKEILRENRLKPSEVLFIDNNSKNIQAAQKAGIKSIHYQNQNDIFKLKDLLYHEFDL